MMRVSVSIFPLYLALAIGSPPVSSSLVASPPDPGFLVESLTGSTNAAGHFVLELVAGPIATRAIKVYSEPSHTLLLRAIDRDFAASPAGQEWLAGQAQEPAQVETVSEPLPGSHASLALAGPARDDNRIAAWVFGSWPGGVVEERLISDATVNVWRFSFSTYADPAAPPRRPHPLLHDF